MVKSPVASTRFVHIVLLTMLACLVATASSAQGHGEESLNTRLVGADDLQARSAYQPLPVEQDSRHILYVGHHAGEMLNPLTNAVEVNGTSIVDVTDPTNPVYLHHIPATGDAQGAQMVQVCSGADLPDADPGETYLLRSNGNESHELWDVSDPAALVTTVARMGRGGPATAGRTPTRTGGSVTPVWRISSARWMAGARRGWSRRLTCRDRVSRGASAISASTACSPIRPDRCQAARVYTKSTARTTGCMSAMARLGTASFRLSIATASCSAMPAPPRRSPLARVAFGTRRSVVWTCRPSGGRTPLSPCSGWRSQTTGPTAIRGRVTSWS